MRKINVAVFIIIVIIMPVTFRLVHPTSYNKRECVFTTIIVDVVVDPTNDYATSYDNSPIESVTTSQRSRDIVV